LPSVKEKQGRKDCEEKEKKKMRGKEINISRVVEVRSLNLDLDIL
jgi:hypothetical protein